MSEGINVVDFTFLLSLQMIQLFSLLHKQKNEDQMGLKLGNFFIILV